MGGLYPMAGNCGDDINLANFIPIVADFYSAKIY